MTRISDQAPLTVTLQALRELHRIPEDAVKLIWTIAKKIAQFIIEWSAKHWHKKPATPALLIEIPPFPTSPSAAAPFIPGAPRRRATPSPLTPAVAELQGMIKQLAEAFIHQLISAGMVSEDFSKPLKPLVQLIEKITDPIFAKAQQLPVEEFIHNILNVVSEEVKLHGAVVEESENFLHCEPLYKKCVKEQGIHLLKMRKAQEAYRKYRMDHPRESKEVAAALAKSAFLVEPEGDPIRTYLHEVRLLKLVPLSAVLSDPAIEREWAIDYHIEQLAHCLVDHLVGSIEHPYAEVVKIFGAKELAIFLKRIVDPLYMQDLLCNKLPAIRQQLIEHALRSNWKAIGPFVREYYVAEDADKNILRENILLRLLPTSLSMELDTAFRAHIEADLQLILEKWQKNHFVLRKVIIPIDLELASVFDRLQSAKEELKTAYRQSILKYIQHLIPEYDDVESRYNVEKRKAQREKFLGNCTAFIAEVETKLAVKIQSHQPHVKVDIRALLADILNQDIVPPNTSKETKDFTLGNDIMDVAIDVCQLIPKSGKLLALGLKVLKGNLAPYVTNNLKPLVGSVERIITLANRELQSRFFTGDQHVDLDSVQALIEANKKSPACTLLKGEAELQREIETTATICHSLLSKALEGNLEGSVGVNLTKSSIKNYALPDPEQIAALMSQSFTLLFSDRLTNYIRLEKIMTLAIKEIDRLHALPSTF